MGRQHTLTNTELKPGNGAAKQFVWSLGSTAQAQLTKRNVHTPSIASGSARRCDSARRPGSAWFLVPILPYDVHLSRICPSLASSTCCIWGKSSTSCNEEGKGRGHLCIHAKRYDSPRNEQNGRCTDAKGCGNANCSAERHASVARRTAQHNMVPHRQHRVVTKRTTVQDTVERIVTDELRIRRAPYTTVC